MLSAETRLEVKSTLSLSSIFGLRMLATFMLIPIFTTYTQTLPGATPLLIGVAMGIYGLTQAVFQIPLGTCSDKLGRKPIAILGLLIFALGSLIGAFAHNILWMIFARALQGMGAIGSTLMALLADLTSEKNRTKAMAAVGIAMGLFSALAMGAGPIIGSYFGLSGVFITSALLTGVSLLILCLLVPTSANQQKIFPTLPTTQLIKQTLKDRRLLELNLGIFSLHALFTAAFYACPIMLKPLLPDTGKFYLLILGGSFLLLFPLISKTERKGKTSLAFAISITFLLISQLMLIFFHYSLASIAAALFLFFVGFNFLESILPSMVSKAASPTTKGTAMGIYSCSQFLGIFIGGTLAGSIFSWGGVQGIFIFTTILSFIWLLVSLKLNSKIK